MHILATPPSFWLDEARRSGVPEVCAMELVVHLPSEFFLNLHRVVFKMVLRTTGEVPTTA